MNHHKQLKKHLLIALALNAVIIVGELTGGFLSKSIGLMSDAVHNSIDQGALFLSLYAHILSAKPATKSKTFGYHRFGIVATFINTFLLLVTAAALGVWGIVRLFHPISISGFTVIIVALVSSFANFGIALVLQQWAKGNLNIRSAFIHMLSDAWVSLGVVVSAVGILFSGWLRLDPLISLVIVAVIIKGAWPLFKESLDILLESVPSKLDLSRVMEAIESFPEVKKAHDIHLWGIEPQISVMTCHIIVEKEALPHAGELLKSIRSKVLREFGIRHQTIQVEADCCHPETVHCNLESSNDPHREFVETMFQSAVSAN